MRCSCKFKVRTLVGMGCCSSSIAFARLFLPTGSNTLSTVSFLDFELHHLAAHVHTTHREFKNKRVPVGHVQTCSYVCDSSSEEITRASALWKNYLQTTRETHHCGGVIDQASNKMVRHEARCCMLAVVEGTAGEMRFGSKVAHPIKASAMRLGTMHESCTHNFTRQAYLRRGKYTGKRNHLSTIVWRIKQVRGKERVPLHFIAVSCVGGRGHLVHSTGRAAM